MDGVVAGPVGHRDAQQFAQLHKLDVVTPVDGIRLQRHLRSVQIEALGAGQSFEVLRRGMGGGAGHGGAGQDTRRDQQHIFLSAHIVVLLIFRYCGAFASNTIP